MTELALEKRREPLAEPLLEIKPGIVRLPEMQSTISSCGTACGRQQPASYTDTTR